MRRTHLAILLPLLALALIGILAGVVSSRGTPTADLVRLTSETTATTPPPTTLATPETTPPPPDPYPVGRRLLTQLQLLLGTLPTVPPGDAVQLAQGHLERLQGLLGSAAQILAEYRNTAVPLRFPSDAPPLWLEIGTGDNVLCLGPSQGVEFYDLTAGPCRIAPAEREFYRQLLAASTAEEFAALLTDPTSGS